MAAKYALKLRKQGLVLSLKSSAGFCFKFSKFMEELRERDFTKTYCVTLVSDKPFYQGKVNTGIYRYFREEFSVYGDIFKLTGPCKNDECISLAGKYDFIWRDLNKDSKYYIIEI